MTAPRTLYLETMGCQMNVLDSELVAGELLRRGYLPTEDLHAADLVVLNTCSVRQHAEDKVWSRLGELKATRRERSGRVIAVIGCMAERDGDSLLKRVPHVDVLCGPSDLNLLPALVEDVLTGRGQRAIEQGPRMEQNTRAEQDTGAEFPPLEKGGPGGGRPRNGSSRAAAPRAVALSGRLRDRRTELRSRPDHDDLEALDSGRRFGLHEAAGDAPGGAHHAYVRITRGCNKFCAFCVVPMTRGMEQHRPPDQIVSEVRRLAATGVREVTLLGQTVNHYVWKDDRGRRTSFADLLRRVHDEAPDLPRLRFVTSFPRDFTDEALRVMAESPRICRYLHIPAQSGSDRILRLMNRGYTVAQYRDLLDRARTLMPDISLSGDMIVGFPGETEADFAATAGLLRDARYKNCFIFKYSPRPGTAAWERFIDDVPDEIKRRRNNDLLALQAEVNLSNHRALIGRTVEVLVGGPSKAALKRRAAEATVEADLNLEPIQESEQSRGDEVDGSSLTSGALSPLPAGEGSGVMSLPIASSRVQTLELPLLQPERASSAVALPLLTAAPHRPSASRASSAPRATALQLVGRTTGDQIVVFEGPLDWTGRIMPVEIFAITPYTLHARAVADSSPDGHGH